MANNKTNSNMWRIGGLIVVLAVAWMKYQESSGVSQGKVTTHTSNESSARHQKSKHSTSQKSNRRGVPNASKKLKTLEGCRLISHRHNDGDSFHVRCSAGEVEFRLYYVDAPESAARRYRNGENNYKRIAQQGKAMGGLTQKQTTGIGQDAKHFVKALLEKHPFRVVTKWEYVFGPERRYAFVLVKWGGEERLLHEILVEKGFARIHTKPATLPDGTSISTQLRHLRKFEKRAKQKKLGAWGLK